MASGRITAALYEQDAESARVIMRRFIWMLNDESGGIGWGVPEAMAAALRASDGLAREYGSIFFSYALPGCNFLEHQGLQNGILWGLGHIGTNLIEYEPVVRTRLLEGLRSLDSFARGISAWACGRIRLLQAVDLLKQLLNDPGRLFFFDENDVKHSIIGLEAGRAIERITISGS